MVLNSNDFDFLQSRGAKSVDPEEDRRSSLLLRFDPLSRRLTQKLQLPPTTEIVESAVARENGCQETDPALCYNSSKDRSSDELQSSKAQSQATDAAEMSVSLIHDSNNMDNDANSYVNNIK